MLTCHIPPLKKCGGDNYFFPVVTQNFNGLTNRLKLCAL